MTCSVVGGRQHYRQGKNKSFIPTAILILIPAYVKDYPQIINEILRCHLTTNGNRFHVFSVFVCSKHLSSVKMERIIKFEQQTDSSCDTVVIRLLGVSNIQQNPLIVCKCSLIKLSYLILRSN